MPAHKKREEAMEMEKAETTSGAELEAVLAGRVVLDIAQMLPPGSTEEDTEAFREELHELNFPEMVRALGQQLAEEHLLRFRPQISIATE